MAQRMKILEGMPGAVIAMEFVTDAMPRQFGIERRDMLGRWVELDLMIESLGGADATVPGGSDE